MQQFVSPVYLGGAPETFHKELKVKKKQQQNTSIPTAELKYSQIIFLFSDI